MNYQEKLAFAAEVSKALKVIGAVPKVKERFIRLEDQMFAVQLANSAASIARAHALGMDQDELLMTAEERLRNQRENDEALAVVRAMELPSQPIA